MESTQADTDHGYLESRPETTDFYFTAVGIAEQSTVLTYNSVVGSVISKSMYVAPYSCASISRIPAYGFLRQKNWSYCGPESHECHA